MLSSVLLPAPDGPIIAVSWPDRNVPLMPCRISFVTTVNYYIVYHIKRSIPLYYLIYMSLNSVRMHSLVPVSKRSPECTAGLTIFSLGQRQLTDGVPHVLELQVHRDAARETEIVLVQSGDRLVCTAHTNAVVIVGWCGSISCGRRCGGCDFRFRIGNAAVVGHKAAERRLACAIGQCHGLCPVHNTLVYVRPNC